MDIPQMSFEFYQWEEAFKTWEENLPLYGDAMQFVISTHPNTAGYWIEKKGTELKNGDYLYTGRKVIYLKRRIENEIFAAKRDCRTPNFIK